MSVHESVVEALPKQEEIAAPAATERRRRTPTWLGWAGYIALIWLSTYAVLLHDRSIPWGLGLATLLTAVWFVALQLSRKAARVHFFALGESGTLALGAGVGLVAASAVAAWAPGLDLRPLPLLAMTAAITILTIAWRTFLDQSDVAQRSLLIVGAGRAAVDLIETLAQQERSPFTPIAVVDDEHDEETVAGVPMGGRISELPYLVTMKQPDLVVLAVDRNRPEVFQQLLEVAEGGFKVVGLPEFYEHAFGRVPVRHLTAAWFMSVLHLYQRPYTRFAKRTLDVIVASLAMVVVAPLLPLLVVLVRRSGRQVIFRQTRLGEGGRHFTMLKFRTMVEGAEEPETPLWAEERDPRITSVGRFLRKTRLDELPQLVNVLKGEMSVVGPRPERPEFLTMLEEAVPFWTRRHLLKPGITGWAQVKNGYASDYAGTEEKLSYDLWYLRHRSLLVDLLICAKTIPKLLSGSGAR